MKAAVIDIQGFLVDSVFHPKELTLKRDSRIIHFLVKPIKPFCALSESDKKQVRYLQGHHSGLSYNSGYVECADIPSLLETYLWGVDCVYVKGHQKGHFLRDILDIEVVNVESYLGVPKFKKDATIACPHHYTNEPWVCSLRNCEILYEWLTGILSNGGGEH